MFRGRLMPGADEFGISVATAAATTKSGAEALAGLSKIAKLFAGVRVEDDGADRDFQNRVFAGAAVAVGAFAMAAAVAAKFAIVAVAQERVVGGVRFGGDM